MIFHFISTLSSAYRTKIVNRETQINYIIYFQPVGSEIWRFYKKKIPHILQFGRYIYIYRLWGYDVLWNTKFFVFRVCILNLKVQTADLSSWTWYSNWNNFGDQILYFFEKFYYFLDGYKVCWSNDFYTIQN
jgi:hypothetical protein